MGTIAERIMEVVKKENINKSEFARRINVTPAYISKLGKNPDAIPSDRTIADICREFKINELWLRTGEGEMKRALEGEDRFALNIGKLQNTDNETLIRWVNAIAETNPELLKDIEDFFKRLLDIKKEPD